MFPDQDRLPNGVLSAFRIPSCRELLPRNSAQFESFGSKTLNRLVGFLMADLLGPNGSVNFYSHSGHANPERPLDVPLRAILKSRTAHKVGQRR